MAAPTRRPQYLLPWIASCTLVLGAGLHLLTQSGNRSEAPKHRADLTDSGKELAQPLPARLDPEGAGLMVRGDLDGEWSGFESLEQHPSLRGDSAPGEALMTDSALSEAQLAARRELTAESTAPRELKPGPEPLPSAGPRRPARSGNAGSSAPEAVMDRLLPQIGSSFSFFWVDGDASQPPASEPGSVPPVELRITRLDQDSYGAVLFLPDEAGAPSAEPESGDGFGTRVSGAEVEHSGEEPRERASERERWTRWFAAAPLPHQGGAETPQSRAELQALLTEVLGERKARYLAASTRVLDAHAAAQLLGEARRWTLAQRQR